jgi:pimeloyl-ACP methyl ester carboxylesterase
MNSMQVVAMPGAETDITLSVELDDERPGAPAQIALLAHGAGSSADFVRRAFGGPLAAAGWRLASYDLRGHGRSTAVQDAARLDVAAHAADLSTLAERLGATLLGGVSIGAHAAVRATSAASEADRVLARDGLLLALPAWTGAPDIVAAANAVQAAELARDGTAPVLDRICRDHPGWVADELAAAWPHHDVNSFVAVLRGLAASAAPTPAELRRIDVPVGLVALRDDPMHPADVAHRWAAALPRAVVAEVDFSAPEADRAVLGAAAITAWRRATQKLSASP